MVSEKQVDEAMSILCHYYETYPEGHFITISGMHMSGIKNSDTVVNVLEEKELVTVRNEHKGVSRSECPIQLTPKGKTYFIDKQSKKTITRNQFIRDAFVALLGAVVGSLVTWFISRKPS